MHINTYTLTIVENVGRMLGGIVQGEYVVRAGCYGSWLGIGP